MGGCQHSSQKPAEGGCGKKMCVFHTLLAMICVGAKSTAAECCKSYGLKKIPAEYWMLGLGSRAGETC